LRDHLTTRPTDEGSREGFGGRDTDASAEGYPELGNVLDGGKKLAILGLPWETS
jgi:hypothetical protein